MVLGNMYRNLYFSLGLIQNKKELILIFYRNLFEIYNLQTNY
jgi:hypothetical protein